VITLTVNGKERELAGPIKLTAFLETLEIDPRYVAVAHNGNVIERQQWPQVTLQDGDVVEIVRMVGGGGGGHDRFVGLMVCWFASESQQTGEPPDQA